ncbi:4189_t:CDS:2, partial [Paraglomus occultum]
RCASPSSANEAVAYVELVSTLSVAIEVCDNVDGGDVTEYATALILLKLYRANTPHQPLRFDFFAWFDTIVLSDYKPVDPAYDVTRQTWADQTSEKRMDMKGNDERDTDKDNVMRQCDEDDRTELGRSSSNGNREGQGSRYENVETVYVGKISPDMPGHLLEQKEIFHYKGSMT